MKEKTLQQQLERALDDYEEWLRIYGHVPSGCVEPTDRARERAQLKTNIETLKAKLRRKA